MTRLSPADYGSADDSGDRTYRYTLGRVLSWFDTDVGLFIMLNPSTATDDSDDPHHTQVYRLRQASRVRHPTCLEPLASASN